MERTSVYESVLNAGRKIEEDNGIMTSNLARRRCGIRRQWLILLLLCLLMRHASDAVEAVDESPSPPVSDESTSEEENEPISGEAGVNTEIEDTVESHEETIPVSNKTPVIQEEEHIRDFDDLQDPNRQDTVEDSMLDPLASDPSCRKGNADCWEPPTSTIETEIQIDATCSYGGDDPSSTEQVCTEKTVEVDKHWGSDKRILRMRDQLRNAGSGSSGAGDNTRPPIFLLPGLASTRLVAWRHKACPSHPLLSDIKIQDYVWLNINLIIQMGTIDVACMKECMKLGLNQTDTDDLMVGCKLRPDEGLDAISSLAPGGLGSKFLVGGTNTVYAWLIQWLADNLGYDVGNIIGLPYDWRLSPDRMEERDGFLTLTRRRIEAAVKSNGQPGIMVAHSVRS